ncbi:hypothetical protein ACHAWF_004045 [Thalassiosira exigua]
MDLPHAPPDEGRSIRQAYQTESIRWSHIRGRSDHVSTVEMPKESLREAGQVFGLSIRGAEMEDVDVDVDGRSRKVMERMRLLTGMAAIGGFLFGYDTGAYMNLTFIAIFGGNANIRPLRRSRGTAFHMFVVGGKELMSTHNYAGVISGAMLPLKLTLDLNLQEQETVVSATILAAFLSSLVGGNLNAAYGRKVCLQLAASVFTVGSLLLGVAWDYRSLVAGRIILGCGVGLASLTTPVYIAEVALTSMRGALVTINAFLVCFG